MYKKHLAFELIEIELFDHQTMRKQMALFNWIGSCT